MKRKIMAIAGLLVFAILAAVPLAVHAHEESTAQGNIRNGEAVTVGANETIDASTYLAGKTVTVAGTVQGDLYCAGQNIDITGRVEGDVICAGQTVHVSGTVVGNVRVAGQTVTIDGPVGKNVSAFGQSVVLAGNSVVNGDVTLFGSALQLAGKVGRDAVIGGETATLSGSVARNMTVTDDQLTLAGGAKVAGDLSYTSASEALVDKGAAVGGETHRHQPPANKSSSSAQNEWAAKFGMAAYWFGATLVFGLALLVMMPRTLDATSGTMLKQSGWSLLAGLATLIATPIVAIILMATVIGVPLGFVLLFAWLGSLVVAFVYAGYSAGRWIAEQLKWELKWPRFIWLLVGLLVVWLGMLVPVVGGMIGFLALVWGLGGITLAYGAYLKTNKTSASTKKAKS